MCGVAIEYCGSHIISIKGDQQDPFSKGYICAKALALQDIHEDPDRLKYPVKKTAHGWRKISWREAFNVSSERIKTVQSMYGKDAVATYIGNPTAHNHGNLLMLKGFLDAIGSINRYSATSVDQLPLMLAAKSLFGSSALFPIPDLDRMTFLIILGGNPLASGGSFMSGPDIKKRFERIKARPGGRIVNVDPRFTETSAVASEHYFISPGKDAFLLLAMMQVIFSEGLETSGSLPVVNLEALKVLVKDFEPQRVAIEIEFDSGVIIDLARTLANQNHAAIYGRLGTSIQEYGSLCSWLICVLNIITGNMDVEGGMMFTRPAIDLAGLGAVANQVNSFNTRRSRVRRLPDFAGEFPAATLADEMLVGGEGQIKALVTLAGNPVLSIPNGVKMEQALKGLDFMLSFDMYINESSCYADIIIPPTSPLEHGHYDIAIQLVAFRHNVKYSAPLFEKSSDSFHEWQSMLEVFTRINSKGSLSHLMAGIIRKIIYRLGDEGLLDILLRVGPYGRKPETLMRCSESIANIDVWDIGTGFKSAIAKFNLWLRQFRRINALLEVSPFGSNSIPIQEGLSIDKLKEFPHGIDIGPLKPVMPERLNTEDKKINLHPGIYCDAINELKAHFSTIQSKAEAGADVEETSSAYDLQLIGRRHIRSNNSWLHNSDRLVKGKNRCTVLMNPIDAKGRNFRHGQRVRVVSKVGAIELELEVTDAIKRGVISIPHGWGHHRDRIQLSRAAQSAGVSVNDITNDECVEKLTGVAICNGVPVKVEGINDC